MDQGWESVIVLASVGSAAAVGGPRVLSVDAALGIDAALDGWIGLALVARGVALAVEQIAAFFRPRIGAEA